MMYMELARRKSLKVDLLLGVCVEHGTWIGQVLQQGAMALVYVSDYHIDKFAQVRARAWNKLCCEDLDGF